MSDKRWIKFVRNGGPHGFGYFAGDVVELPKDQCDSLVRLGSAFPASQEDIDLGLLRLAEQHQKEQARLAARAGDRIRTADLKGLEARLLEMEALIAGMTAAPKKGKKADLEPVSE